jgi:hypothetical protein
MAEDLWPPGAEDGLPSPVEHTGVISILPKIVSAPTLFSRELLSLKNMHDNVIAMPAPTVRQAGFLEKTLFEIPSSRWASRRSELAAAYNRCPRVRMILSRNADKFGVDLDDLKQDVWMVFQEKMLPILDSPSNVYSVLYRCSELCSRSLINSVKETTLSIGPDEEVDEVMHRLLEANGPTGQTMDEQIEIGLDTQKARLTVQKKLERFGWPEGIPREESAYRRAGRPLKEAQPVTRNDDEGEPMKQQSMLFRTSFAANLEKSTEPAEIIRQKEQSAPREVSPEVEALTAVREQMQVPVVTFAELIDARADTIRALLYGTHVNPTLTLQLTKSARAALAKMRKDPDLALLMKMDMAKIVKKWRVALDLPDDIQTLKLVSEQTGRKYATMYRWHQENRKPVNIYDLYEIDKLVRIIAAKKAGSKKVGAAAEPVAAKKMAVKKAAAKKSTVEKKPVAKKAAKTASRSKR